MSDLRLGQSKEYLDKKAADENLIVFLPNDDEVFLDLDNPIAMFPNPKVMQYLAKSLTIDIIGILETVSKSGRKHMYIRVCRDLTDLERVILQVCLGSDPVKELFSFIQLHHVQIDNEFNCDCPVALFETAAMAKKVEEWRAAQ